MTDILEDKSNEGKYLREKAVKLAIEEIGAYKNSVPSEGYTSNLLNSAAAIAKFIQHGTLPS